MLYIYIKSAREYVSLNDTQNHTPYSNHKLLQIIITNDSEQGHLTLVPDILYVNIHIYILSSDRERVTQHFMLYTVEYIHILYIVMFVDVIFFISY